MTSPVSNGSAGLPIPATAHAHCLALLPDAENAMARFLASVAERLPELEPVDPGTFAVVEQPRPCTFTRLQAGRWAWHLLIDPGGMPPSVAEAVREGNLTPELVEAVDDHKTSVMIFLIDAPDESTPMERFQALLQVAYAWLDAGATMLAFPEGQTAVPRRLLLNLEPEQIQAEHCYLFLTNGVAQQEKGTWWLRTWGMAQFALPDLAAGIAEDTVDESRMESLKLLFETLPPAMIREHGVLPVGGTVDLSGRTWTAVGPPGPGQVAFMASRFGFQLFV